MAAIFPGPAPFAARNTEGGYSTFSGFVLARQVRQPLTYDGSGKTPEPLA